MTSSTSFSNRVLVVLLAALVVQGCAAVTPQVLPVVSQAPLIAVLPVQNLSGGSAPLKELRQSILEILRKQGVGLLSDEDLQAFMARHRMRYVGGIDAGLSRAFGAETGSGGVLVVSLAHLDETPPPKVALFARLVSTGEIPKVIWTDSVGLAGDDAPGLLDIGLIEDPLVLAEKALSALTGSLLNYLAGAPGPSQGGVRNGRFGPKRYYDALEPAQG